MKINKKLIKYGISLLIVLYFSIIENKAQDILNGYLIQAAENNPGLKSQFNSYMSSVARVSQVGSLPDLNIAFGYFIMPVETRVGPQNFKASISQSFPWFGQLKSDELVNSELSESQLEKMNEAKSKLYYDVKSAYYKLYFVDKGIDITKKNLEILNTFKNLAVIKFESGQASAVDELRVEMEIADLENKLAFLLDSKYELQVAFNRLLNVSDKDIIFIPDSLWDDNLTYTRIELMDSISTNNHYLKHLSSETKSWEAKQISAKKKSAPSFLIGVDWIGVGESDNLALDPAINGRDALMAKVGISIPLYRKKYDGMIQEASYQIQASKYQINEEINQLSILFEQGYSDYNDANRRIHLYQKQLKFAAQALDILVSEYSTNSKNFEEVLRMERKVLMYELELDKAKAEKNTAVGFIEYLMGR